MQNYFKKLPKELQDTIVHYQPFTSEQLELCIKRNNFITYISVLIFLLLFCAWFALFIFIGVSLEHHNYASSKLFFAYIVLTAIMTAVIFFIHYISKRILKIYAKRTILKLNLTGYKPYIRFLDSHDCNQICDHTYNSLKRYCEIIPELGISIATILSQRGKVLEADLKLLRYYRITEWVGSIDRKHARQKTINEIRTNALGILNYPPTLCTNPDCEKVEKSMTPEQFFLKHPIDVIEAVIAKNKHLKSDYFDTQKMESYCGTPVREGIDVKRSAFIAALETLLDSHKLVEQYGGLIPAEMLLKNQLEEEEYTTLKRAVKVIRMLSAQKNENNQ